MMPKTVSTPCSPKARHGDRRIGQLRAAQRHPRAHAARGRAELASARRASCGPCRAAPARPAPAAERDRRRRRGRARSAPAPAVAPTPFSSGTSRSARATAFSKSTPGRSRSVTGRRTFSPASQSRARCMSIVCAGSSAGSPAWSAPSRRRSSAACGSIGRDRPARARPAPARPRRPRRPRSVIAPPGPVPVDAWRGRRRARPPLAAPSGEMRRRGAGVRCERRRSVTAGRGGRAADGAAGVGRAAAAGAAAAGPSSRIERQHRSSRHVGSRLRRGGARARRSRRPRRRSGPSRSRPRR